MENNALFKIGDTIKFTSELDGVYEVGTIGIVESVKDKDGLFNYDIKSSGELINDVPENSITSYYQSIDKKVDEILRLNEASKKFKDSDVRVSGSRKELMVYKGLITSSDLLDLENDEATARALIKKSKVYPEFNIQDEIDKGVSGGTAYLKMKLRDACGNNPPNNKESRAIYVTFIEYVNTRFSEVKTLFDFQQTGIDLAYYSLRRFILIANPELEDEINKQKEEFDEEVSHLRDYRIEVEKLYKKIADLNNGYYPFSSSHWLTASEEEKKLKEQYDYYNNLVRVISNYDNNKILPLEKEFADKISKDINKKYQLSSRSISMAIIEEIFGKRFLNILNINNSDKLYSEAFAFEKVTKEQYEEKLKYADEKYYKKSEKYSKWFQFLNDSNKSFKEIVDFAKEETDIHNWFNERGSLYGIRGKANLENLLKYGTPENTLRFIKSIANNYSELANKHYTEYEEYKKLWKIRDNDYSFAEKKEGKKIERKTELVANSSEPLSFIKRTGGVAVFNDDLNNGDKVLSFYKKILGVSGITFGKSLPDNERNAHAKHYAGALLDICELINYDVKEFVSLQEKGLGIMFGAAGKSGSAAHYSTLHNAINLTRGNGDGTVAHELAHYIDRSVAKRFPKEDKSVGRFDSFASYTENQNVSNDNIKNAFRAVMRFIKEGAYIIDGSPLYPYLSSNILTLENYDKIKRLLDLYFIELTEKVIPIEIKVADKNILKSKIKNDDGTIIEDLDTALEISRKRNPNYFNYYNYNAKESKRLRLFFQQVLNGYGVESKVINFNNDYKKLNYSSYLGVPISTAYFINCKNMNSPYWTYDWELFARAFETYISTKQMILGRENNYLVSGAYFNRPEQVYPVGAERDVIYILIDNLMNVIKKELEISDFIPFRTERMDEYIVLGENDLEKESVVDVNIINVDDKKDKDEEIITKLSEYWNKIYDSLMSSKINTESSNFKFGGLVGNLFNFAIV